MRTATEWLHEGCHSIQARNPSSIFRRTNLAIGTDRISWQAGNMNHRPPLTAALEAVIYTPSRYPVYVSFKSEMQETLLVNINVTILMGQISQSLNRDSTSFGQ
jgi:hypothetical protein